jgi:sulfide:quinone oxidoreductase
MAEVAAQLASGRLRLVVAGAGVAGLEALVALHTLAPGRIDATLLDPGDTFRLRALDVGEPFGMRSARRYPLPDLARDLGAGLVREPIGRVDPVHRAAVLRSGRRIGYDVLLLATGSRPYPAMSEGVLFDPTHGPAVLETLAAQPAGRTAVVVPPGVGWTLPAYELALALSTRPGAEVTLVTAEREPLEAFGSAGARLAREELGSAGVALVAGVRAVADSPTRLVYAGGALAVDRIVHLPRHVGPGIPGIPSDATGFVLTGPDGAVPGYPDVFAAGDGTAGSIKHGGLAAQQAERAALRIAALAGAEVGGTAAPPALHGVLRTPHGPRYLRATMDGDEIVGEVSRRPLWWPPTKVASSWLTPWLTTRDAHRGAPGPVVRPAPAPGQDRTASFRRLAGRNGRQQMVSFERCATARSGWWIAEADGAGAALVTLADALALLNAADGVVAVAVHTAALEATCVLIGALRDAVGQGADAAALRRLARLAGQAEELAAELAAVREPSVCDGRTG